jgi:alkanesulfonate monooxygenase SsuD/methylene tetrahydromethanopterin reductase-like flavin-dependent oxidoreductase (luciferase family)
MLFDRRVIRVDAAMAEQAVRQGARIGVLATLSTTLAPTSDLVRRKAREAGREVDIVDRLCAGAFEALMGGDPAMHDRVVGQALTQLARDVDVIVLAQASIARVLAGLPAGAVTKPVLSSPELGVMRVRDMLFGPAGEGGGLAA